jgi:hypothetical protein
MTEEFDDATTSPSRRQIIKGAAVGTAVVWTAPVLSSVTSPAFAASAAGCGKGFTCADPTQITFCGTSPGGDFECICYAETDPDKGQTGNETGNSFCGQDFFCGSFIDYCGPGGQCAPGYQCQSGCCGPNICAPLCGTVVTGASAKAASGARNSGK